jgi:diaminobutyrate-2-oxoglutarate transaminase
MHLDAFERDESEVRYYCRKLPNLLTSASGAIVRDDRGNSFIDFLSACGALNYGHNHPKLKAAALEYLGGDGIVASLDFHTSAKLAFVERFRDAVLLPRGLNYKLQFPGPTGANCVEAAIKLARKATGRASIAAFTNAFHGMSAGALALTGSRRARRASTPVLNGVVRIPFEGYRGAGVGDLERLEAMACDPSGGIDPIAGVIVETIQGEGGLNVASADWLRALAAITRRLGALLIIDDIQAGCGRTGSFFSFERAGIVPDVVCLAKSISGYGLPMSLLLLKPEHDVWEPGEHNGTFRGNSLAFATAKAAIDLWESGEMAVVQGNSHILSRWTRRMSEEFGNALRPKGHGLMQGLEFSKAEHAQAAAAAAVERGVIVECCGPYDEVLKIMPPLNIEPEILLDGLDRVADAIRGVLSFDAGCPSDLPGSSKRYETHFDTYDDGGDAIVRSEFAHPVA